MKPLGMLLLAVALGVAAWWWYTQEMPRRERERAVAAEAAAIQAERANSLHDVMAAAAAWYTEQLQGVKGGEARQYLQEIGRAHV